MEYQSVPSGEYVVSGKRTAVLKACLGTCVGITLCDRQAGLGGLIHILLPEPTGTDVAFKPGMYASTGVPNFIRDLCDEGASIENLEACVAGGALVGPVSDLDLSLDIGGRTTEVCQKILDEYGIPIKQIETGGYFSCLLSLDLMTLENAIEPITNPVDNHSEMEIKELTRMEVDMAIQRVRPIPQIALKILRMVQKDDYSMDEVGKEVRLDQVISAKTLNLCNSARFGLRNRIDSIDHALRILGDKRFLNLILSASLETMFPESSSGYSLCKGGIFQHALGAALIASELSSFTGRSNPGVAYTAGLLHDIGKIPLDQYVAPVAPYFYRAINETGTALCELERENFGVSHPETGKLLGEQWALPENLLSAIMHHHRPEEAEEDQDLATLVYFADLLMSRFQVKYELEKINTDQIKNRLNFIGLVPEQFPIIIDRIPHEIFQPPVSQD